MTNKSDVSVLHEALTEAACTLRRYEKSHRAKNTDDSNAKAEVNAELAGRFEAILATTERAAIQPADADIDVMLRELIGIADSNRRGVGVRVDDMRSLARTYQKKRADLKSGAPVAIQPAGDAVRDANDVLLDRLADILDAKEIMLAHGIKQNDFPSMFAEFAALKSTPAAPVASAPVRPDACTITCKAMKQDGIGCPHDSCDFEDGVRAPSQPMSLEAERVDAWQPIETAPNDGRTLLLGRFNKMGNWRTMRGQWFTQAVIDDEWEDPDGFEAGWYETAVEPDAPNCWCIAPTHWQPLPPPPAIAALATQQGDKHE